MTENQTGKPMSTENFLRICEFGALQEVMAAIEAGAERRRSEC